MLVPKPLPNQGCSLMTATVWSHGPLRDAITSAPALPLYKNSELMDSGSLPSIIPIGCGMNTAVSAAIASDAAITPIISRYFRIAIQTTKDETAAPAIPARAYVLISSTVANTRHDPKRRLLATDSAHKNPHSSTGTTTTPIIAPIELGFPKIAHRSRK